MSLGSNCIGSFEEVRCLASIPELIQLDLSDTPLSKLPDYRQRLFEMLPTLEILDNLDRNGGEMEYSAEGDFSEDNIGDEEGEEESEDPSEPKKEQ